MKKYLLKWLFFVGLITTLQAQEVDLKGKVLDENGIPVTGAKLTLKKININCQTDANGQYQIKNGTAIKYEATANQSARIGINRKYLELGTYYNATISVFSIKGELLNRVIIENKDRVQIDYLLPATIKSQIVIISIFTGDKKINVRSVKYGPQWLLNKHSYDNTSNTTTNNRTAVAADAIDTLVVQKDGKQTVTLPITAFVASLADIVLYDIAVESMIGDVTFSVPSKTFKNSLSVTLNTTLAKAKIRYSTDGKLPTSNSTLYDGNPLTINKTTQLRAAAFIADTVSGRHSTAIYIARNFDYTSDIPIVIMEGYGAGKPKDKYNFIDLAFMTFEPVNGVASLDNIPTLSTRAGYHLRGQSSMSMFKQAPYRIELWDNANKDIDYPVLGMPASSDWTLISPCTDNTLIRNVFIFDLGKSMGLATVQYRFAEVFINQDGGNLEKVDHEGIYTLIQPIKNRKTTLNLKNLKPEDTDPLKLSGGYIFKFDQAVNDTDMLKLECTGSKKMAGGFGGRIDTNATCFADLELVEPSNPNSQQIAWITGYIQEFHNALHAKPVEDWKKYIDLNSFVNIHIINEVSRDVDAWIRSHYMYKERNEPIKAGPIWDYNFALGNYSTDLSGWHCEENRVGSNDWHLRMWKQPEFKSAVKTRYSEVRKTLLADAAIDKLIDDVRKPIINVAPRNFEAWPMGKCSSGGFMAPGAVKDTTWSGQIDSLKIWTKKRLKSLDSSFATLP